MVFFFVLFLSSNILKILGRIFFGFILIVIFFIGKYLFLLNFKLLVFCGFFIVDSIEFVEVFEGGWVGRGIYMKGV